MRRSMAVLGAVALLLGVVSAAAAAAPVEPVVTLNTPSAICDALNLNEVTVTASVDTNVDLSGFGMWVSRWEDVTFAERDDFDRLDVVEHWSADFWSSGRGSEVPTEHTLMTTDANTWNRHGWMVESEAYIDNSDLFVITVSAYASGKGNVESVSVWDEWVIDCSDANDVTVDPFTSPWDAEWATEIGDL